eukprot:758403-Hanusia_phi.AAC.6
MAAKKDMERYKEEMAAVRAAIQPRLLAEMIMGVGTCVLMMHNRTADGDQMEWSSSKLSHLAYKIFERNSTSRLKLIHPK